MSPLLKKIVKLKAKLQAGSNNVDGYIENYSDNEIYVVTLPHFSYAGFSSGVPVKLKCELASNEVVDVTGRVKWSYMTPPHGLTRSIGIEVTNARGRCSDIFSKAL